MKPSIPQKTQHQKPLAILQPLSKGNKRFAHPWIYKSQIKKIAGEATSGCEIAVESAKGHVVGTGYYNPQSEIAIRLLSRQQEALSKEFFMRRMKAAKAYRERLAIDSNALRWVNSESDQLAGLIVDQYADTLVLQLLTLGMEHRREHIVKAAEEVFAPKALYERSEGPSRLREGMQNQVGWIRGEGAAKIEIREGAMRFWVDIEKGHKTGFYMDQRDSRAFAWDWKGKRVLDAFTHTGGFAMAAGLGGAKEIIALDVSAPALALAEENAKLNGLSHCRFEQQNAFDHLRYLEQAGELFDAVILDPPSFTRNKDSLEGALKGYKEIHLRAMKLLKPGGLLLTFCCSHHVSLADFQATVLDASRDARCALRVLQWFQQAKDHPIVLSIPETYYLKGMALEVL